MGGQSDARNSGTAASGRRFRVDPVHRGSCSVSLHVAGGSGGIIDRDEGNGPARRGDIGLDRTEVGCDLARDSRGRVTQTDGDLAADVEPCVIVDPEPAIADPVSDEDQRRGQRDLLVGDAWPNRRIPADRKLCRAPPGRQRNPRRALERRAAKRHLDEPASVRATRGQAELPELAGDIIGGNLMPARTRVAALEQVARKELNMGANALGSGIFRGPIRLRRSANEQRGKR